MMVNKYFFITYFINIIYIAESFKLLFEQKDEFYLKNNKNRSTESEINKINDIISRYHLEGLYYNLDNEKHNIFKRIDRYQKRSILIILFVILTSYNVLEIIFSSYMLFITEKDSYDNYPLWQKLLTGILCVINVLAILVLSSITLIKLKIKSSVFY